MPFACAHLPRPDTIRSRWLVYAAPFLAFSFVGAALQLAAVRSLAGTALYVLAGTAAAAGVRRWGDRGEAHDTIPFETPPSHDMQVFNLSEASR